VEPERIEFIRGRIAAFKARIAEGGLHEAAVRSLIYIGTLEAGFGVDERHFKALRMMRARNDAVTLEEFKRMVRRQFYSLLLDREAALAAIPAMLPADARLRARALEAIRKIVSAAGKPTREASRRLAQVEQLFGTAAPAPGGPGRT